jgi:phage N-6-adenine-methyltransferase
VATSGSVTSVARPSSSRCNDYMNEHQRTIMFSTASKKTSVQTGKDTWQTPHGVFNPLLLEFDFTIDGAANESNSLLERWWGPESPLSDDALLVTWGGERVFCNPPYSRVAEFVAKAESESHHSLSVLLIPARTDTRWWHSHIWNRATHQWRTSVGGRFLKGRVKFIDPDNIPLRKRHSNSSPFPSVIIIFG